MNSYGLCMEVANPTLRWRAHNHRGAACKVFITGPTLTTKLPTTGTGGELGEGQNWASNNHGEPTMAIIKR